MSSNDATSPEVSETEVLAHSPTEVERDAEFAFDDANIAIVAQRTAFCVHRGIIARHSEVFRDLFSVPQPQDGEMMFGCPVVHVQDSAGDMRHLLRVLYDGRGSYKTRDVQRPFAEVEALVRLSHKYQIEDLRDYGVQVLMTVFTDKLTVWEALRKSKTVGSRFVSMSSKDAIAAVNIAHLVGAPRMLPVAFYCCSLLDTADLVEGLNSCGLSSVDLKTCIDGRERLAQYGSVEFARVFCEEGSSECTGQGACKERRRRSASFYRGDVDLSGAPRVLGGLEDRIMALVSSYHHAICLRCIEHFRLTHLEFRSRMWDKLPSVFGLEPWSKLGKVQ